jgi:hypothetical protein
MTRNPNTKKSVRTRVPQRRLAKAAILIVVALAAPARAEGPLPQPKLGAVCPTGYEASGGYCMPNRNTRCRAMPKIDATCPVGYTTSGGAYCIETGCQSR